MAVDLTSSSSIEHVVAIPPHWARPSRVFQTACVSDHGKTPTLCGTARTAGPVAVESTPSSLDLYHQPSLSPVAVTDEWVAR